MASISIANYKPAEVKTINHTDYGIVRIGYVPANFEAQTVLPFRVRFTNIGIQSYGAGNAAPIGIAIIGLNNYVM
jgi:hypothetical protein